MNLNRTVDAHAANLCLRQLQASDRARALAALERLSDTSLRQRFGGAIDRSAITMSWVDDLDGETRVAYGACTADEEALVGVARYVVLPDDPAAAEIALTVVDSWQRCGVGMRLLRRLAEHARAQGIRAFTASALEGLIAPEAMMVTLGPTTVRKSWGLLELRAELSPELSQSC